MDFSYTVNMRRDTQEVLENYEHQDENHPLFAVLESCSVHIGVTERYLGPRDISVPAIPRFERYLGRR
jgi:hypothetical protein